MQLFGKWLFKIEIKPAWVECGEVVWEMVFQHCPLVLRLSVRWAEHKKVDDDICIFCKYIGKYKIELKWIDLKKINVVGKYLIAVTILSMDIFPKINDLLTKSGNLWSGKIHQIASSHFFKVKTASSSTASSFCLGSLTPFHSFGGQRGLRKMSVVFLDFLVLIASLRLK